MTVHQLIRRDSEPPSWWSDVLHHLAKHGPIEVADLAAAAGRSDHEVENLLFADPRAQETRTGWVDLLALADGAVFTHQVSRPELEDGQLLAEDDLSMWVRLAEGEGVPLAGGGLLRLEWVDEEMTLVGPDGWLADIQPDELVALRLRDGVIELSTVDEPVLTEEDAERVLVVVEYFFQSARGALAGFAEEVAEDPDVSPAALVDAVLAELLLDQPLAFTDPLPPLGDLLLAASLELYEGFVGLPGTPWDPDEVADLTPEDIVRFTLIRGTLQTSNADSDLTDLLSALEISPQVLDRIADEVEAHPIDTTLLAALERTAEGPRQHGAAALLAARSAEGAGRAEDAARLVEQALEWEPQQLTALRDAAEYAAARGEALRADGLLERAWCEPDEGLRRQLRPLLSLPETSTARNRPCPCGSGVKYKKCCLTRESHPIPIRARLLYGLLLAFAERVRYRDRVHELIDVSHPKAWQACADLALFEGGIAQDFLDQRGAWLRADERELLTRWLRAPLRLHEVVSTSPGHHVVVRALPDGEPISLRDRTLSRSCAPLDLMLARLLDDGAGPALFADPWQVHRMRRAEMMALLSEEPDAEAIARFFGPQPRPELRNREGQELVQCAAVYQVADDDAWGTLAASLSEDGPDRLLAMADDLIRGSVRRKGSQWTVETNSLERLRELQALLHPAAPNARLISESSVPMEDLFGTEPSAGGAPATMSSEEHEHLLEQAAREHERRWVDESIPALGGRTPREAVAQGGAAWAELNALLDDLDWTNRRQGGQGMSAERIRKLLG
ncbi:MAG: SEC-C metal-binding domain-containing protein [Haloechinothrix sp.]